MKIDNVPVFAKVIGLDFDGTVTSGDAASIHDIPKPRKNAAKVITRWINDGFIVIVNTLRDDTFDKDQTDPWEKAGKAYAKKHGIPYTLWNENVPERIAFYGDSRKIAANIYIDDRNLGGIPDDFEEIDELVRKQIGEP